MEIEESGIGFIFHNDRVVKFDDSEFYRRYFNCLPHSKGVDFVCEAGGKRALIEVKNCLGHEAENIWRIGSDNAKREVVTPSPGDDRESLDIEMSLKAAMTIACLCGALSMERGCSHAETLSDICRPLGNVGLGGEPLYIILFLEGNFYFETRSKKMIMERLQTSIRKKLSWLNCSVSVTDSSTYKKKFFTIRQNQTGSC